MRVAKFLGLTYPSNLSSILSPRFSGGGEAWGRSPHPIRAGPRRHRGGGLGALSQGGSGKTPEKPRGHLQGAGGEEAETDTQRQRTIPKAVERLCSQGDLRHRGP